MCHQHQQTIYIRFSKHSSLFKKKEKREDKKKVTSAKIYSRLNSKNNKIDDRIKKQFFCQMSNRDFLSASEMRKSFRHSSLYKISNKFKMAFVWNVDRILLKGRKSFCLSCDLGSNVINVLFYFTTWKYCKTVLHKREKFR